MTVDRMGIDRSLATRREAAIPPPAPEGAPNPAGSRECKTVLEEALAELFERERRLLGFEGELVELRHAIKVLRRASGEQTPPAAQKSTTTDQILAAITAAWEPLSREQIAEAIGRKPAGWLSMALNKMVAAGQLVFVDGHGYSAPA